MNSCIALGGGPTAVINRTLVAAVMAAKQRNEVLLGARHGIDGLLKGEFTRLDTLSEGILDKVKMQPGAAIGSTRTHPFDKKNVADPNWRLKKIMQTLKQNDIRRFIYVGGNDTAEAVAWITKHAEETGADLLAVHGSKTIDNDLMVTDRCPGWASAARFNALTLQGLAQDARALRRVFILEIMGRNSGFLAASAALASTGDEKAPHLIYIPEVVFDEKRFLEEVREAYGKYGYTIVAVSEGIRIMKEGKPVELGQLLKQSTGVQTGASCGFHDVRLSDAGVADYLAELVNGIKLPATGMAPRHLQRSYPQFAENDALDAEMIGTKAFEFAMEGMGGSVVFRQREPGTYSAEVDIVNVALVGGKTRVLDEAFYRGDAANRVTPAFLAYAEPLVGRLPTIVHI